MARTVTPELLHRVHGYSAINNEQSVLKEFVSILSEADHHVINIVYDIEHKPLASDLQDALLESGLQNVSLHLFRRGAKVKQALDPAAGVVTLLSHRNQLFAYHTQGGIIDQPLYVFDPVVTLSSDDVSTLAFDSLPSDLIPSQDCRLLAKASPSEYELLKISVEILTEQQLSGVHTRLSQIDSMSFSKRGFAKRPLVWNTAGDKDG